MTCVGCVLADPPEHGQATQTPPILVANQAQPSPYQVLSASEQGVVDLNVPIRSEDDGDDLLALLVLDYSIKTPLDIQNVGTVAAGTLEDLDRSVTIPWNVPVGEDGCHTLTLEVTHQSNQVARDPADIATVTWFVDINGTGASLADCPKILGGTN